MRVVQFRGYDLKKSIFSEKMSSERKSLRSWDDRDGGVAQLGEHLLCKQGVDSSILFISTKG